MTLPDLVEPDDEVDEWFNNVACPSAGGKVCRSTGDFKQNYHLQT